MYIRDYNPHIGSKDEVIRSYMGLARGIAKRFRWAASRASHIDYQDIVSEAYIGLLKAFDRFDGRVKRFESYAAPMIRWEIQRFLQERGQTVRVTDRTYRLLGAIFREGLEEAAPSTIAARLGCSELDAARALKAWKDGRALSMDKPIASDEGSDDCCLHDIIGRSPDLTGAHVEEFMRQLDSEERDFVQIRVAGERIEQPILLSSVRTKLAAYMGLDKSEVGQMSVELTKEKYLALRAQGKTDAQIYSDFGMGQSQFYRKKKKWGLTAKGGGVRTTTANVQKAKTVPVTPAVEASQAVNQPTEENWKAKYLELREKQEAHFEAEKIIARLEQEVLLLKSILKFYL